jgi:hypothetical protein
MLGREHGVAVIFLYLLYFQAPGGTVKMISLPCSLSIFRMFIKRSLLIIVKMSRPRIDPPTHPSHAHIKGGVNL